MNHDAPLFVSLEGIDGSGKSRIAEVLTTKFDKSYIISDPPNIEPWIQWANTFQQGNTLSKIGQTFLFFTARLDNVARVLKPKFKEGCFIIADRYHDSWLVYQSTRLVQEGYYSELEDALEFLLELSKPFEENEMLIIPDLTFYLDIDPKVALARIDKSIENKERSTRSLYEDDEKFKQYITLYKKIAKRFTSRIQIVDTNGLRINEIVEEIASAINNFKI